jgi:hypothetical protein
MSISAASALDFLTPYAEDRKPRRSWMRKARAKKPEELRENLTFDEGMLLAADTLPGEALSPEAVERQRKRRQLIALITRFASDGLSWNADYRTALSPDTALAATAFFLRFGDAFQLPKIAPDGEGGLMLVWEGHGDPIVGAIDNWRLHLVAGAGTPHAHYIDDVPFDGENIPEQISRRIPLS